MMKTLQQLNSFLRRPIPVLRGTVGEYILIFLILSILTFYYTDWIVLDITHKIFTGGTGDATAGFLWLITADNDFNPAWAHTWLVNFPQGEELTSPTYVTWTMLITPLWILAKIVGPVAALNIVTFAGFITCGLAAYAVIKRLTNQWQVALFAAFAAAFFPYHIFKSTAHLANIFSWVFIVLFGLFISFWHRPTALKALLIALVMAAGFYTDGYFLLLVPVFTASLLLGGLVYDLFFRPSRAKFMRKIRCALLAFVALCILSLPIVKTQLQSGGQVESDLARNNIKSEAQFYSAKKLDFLLPPYENPFFSQFSDFDSLQNLKNQRSNVSENALYIGYVVLALFAAGIAIGFWRFCRYIFRADKNPASSTRQFIFVAMVSLLTVGICLSFMLPLEAHVLGHTIKMPAGYVTDHLSFWRVFTRFILPLHAVMVLFAAIFLAFMIQGTSFKWRSKVRYLPLLLIPVVAFEYATNINRPAWSLSNMTPAYTWLAQQKDIRAIAELPYNDAPYGNPATYFTAQYIHGKALINGRADRTPQYGIRRTQEAAVDPESIEYAIARGADAIITHTRPCKTYSNITLAHRDDGICIFRVNTDAKSKVDNYFIAPVKGFNAVDQQFDATYNTLRSGSVIMELVKARDDLPSRNTVKTVSFTLSTNSQSHPIKAKIIVTQGRKQFYAGTYTDKKLRIDLHDVLTREPITLTISSHEKTLDDQYMISRIRVEEK